MYEMRFVLACLICVGCDDRASTPEVEEADASVTPDVGDRDWGRFEEPLGDELELRLGETPCVDSLKVEVMHQLLPDEDVLISVEPELPTRATLSPAGPGKTRVFTWCPEAPAAVEEHDLDFVASGPDGEFARKPFRIEIRP